MNPKPVYEREYDPLITGGDSGIGQQLEDTFRTNIFSQFYIVKAALPHLKKGAAIIVAPSYVFLASEDGSYVTGQVLHPNGGSIVNT